MSGDEGSRRSLCRDVEGNPEENLKGKSEGGPALPSRTGSQSTLAVFALAIFGT
jgi:hypothetical protein